MTRDDLIKLAVKCHWHRGTLDYLERGLWSIFPGHDDSSDSVAVLRQSDGIRGLYFGSCPLSKMVSVNRPWIIGPFKGKFFSLKSQRFW
jgi:hypothetical protein